MTRVTVHPHRAFRPGNEAVAVDTSATPAEIFYHSSVLGKALYETTDTLGIATYPYQGAVVLEGRNEMIDQRREDLVNRLAPEIAARALQPPYWENSSVPDQDYLTDIVRYFGAPAQDQGGDSFFNRMVRSVGVFGDYTSEDNMTWGDSELYKPPLDPRINEISDTVRRGNEKISKEELQKQLTTICKIDGLTPEQEASVALRFYLDERIRDPLFASSMRYLQLCNRLGLNH